MHDRQSFKRYRQLIRDTGTAILGKEKTYTRGSINRAIFLLSIPMVLEMVMESLFAVVDVFFVGRLGVDAIATVGLTESLVMILYAISVGLSMGVTAMVSRRVGEKNSTGAADATYQAILIACWVAVVTGILGFIYAKELLELMGASESLIHSGYGYTKVMIGGNITIMLLFVLNAAFRGAGDAAIAMRVLWLSNGLNLVLDPIFIFGVGPFDGMGVEGAAIATTLGRGTGVLYQLYLLFRGAGIIQLLKRNLSFRAHVMSRLIRVSLGGIGQYLIGTASWILLVRIISIFGSEAVAGYTISFRIIIFTILPSWGIANAAATLVGQNLGAGLPDRAEKSVWKCAYYNMLFLVFISIVFFIMAADLIRIFNTDPRVVVHGTIALRYICAGYLFFAYGMVVSQAFNGAGDTRTPTLINLFSYWLVQIPLAYLLSIQSSLGIKGIYIAILIAEFCVALLAILIFRKGKWKFVNI